MDFLEIDELKSVLYEYQMNEIAENDTEIILDGIAAGVEEVRGYFEASNNRRETLNLTAQQYAHYKLYDVNAIFNARGAERNAFVLRLCKRVAAWNVCELSNVDVVYQHVKERYEQSISTLEKIAGMGEYAKSHMVISSLPSPAHPALENENNTQEDMKPFRSGSRPKFNHE
ncbi:MAG: hypothetical protein LBU90_10400 [Bacteroidales bacterium]|jgi:hypothetical protein|nr:hypothetical protein [Bacteroidales bacterium]